ncbi:MAG TPA: hypothetical protein VG013_32120 [Gemmataceae bacterium]|jgi:hypothetical protein|nr:hypothetical protein [Gemmataceae bacterium]
MNPLQARLAALRRRLRVVVTFRGLCWLATVALSTAALAGLVDWRLPGHLPSLVRAVILTGALSGAGYVAYRYLLQPLWAPSDDLTLALRIESLYPALNDSLASTVQFLDQAEESEAAGSPGLRRAVVQRALREAQECNFNQVVDTRGVRVAGLSMVAATAMAVTLTLLFPAVARTALARLANPFGTVDWPRQTQLRVLNYRSRIARGEPYEIRCEVSGVVPEYGTIDYQGAGLGKQTYQIVGDRMVARLDHVENSFVFQVRVNDAVSEELEVAVLPPPVLVPLQGRSSPQVRLRYPAYTDLPDQDLPDGSGNIEAVTGTVATLRAATDRPVARAWIEYEPRASLVKEAAILSPLGARDVAGTLALYACGREVWDRVPVRLGQDGQVLAARFVPRVSGTYALHFEDETGLGNHRLFDLRVFPDPAPVVNLERPSQSHDSLSVLPGADVNVQVSAADKEYALRSVFLEYRTGKEEPARRLPLYEHRSMGQALPRVLSVLAAGPAQPGGAGWEPPGLRLRPQDLEMAERLSLKQIKHPDGSDLQEGDVVTLQACADDFDDVAGDKQPGCSHEVELRIVGPAAIEKLVNQAQAAVQQELLRLRKNQQEALEPVIAAEQRWRNTGRLTPRDVDKLIQAQQAQQQVRARVGKKEDGLRAEVDRILQTLRDNHLPRSGAHERMETVAAELARLAREELGQIEPRLATARKDNENATHPKKPTKGTKGPLGEAREHQEEVEDTLNNLLKLMEPWGSINEVKGEAKAIQDEQRKLHEETKNLPKEFDGKEVNNLDPDQKAKLDDLAELQRKLEQRTGQLLGKMERVSEDRKDKDPETARAIKEAARQGREQTLTGNMKRASENLRNNALGKAGAQQQQSLDTLKKVVQQLEERRENELDQLRKKLQAAQDKLAELAKNQAELRKKIKAARAESDPQKREQQLKALSREQEQLRLQAQDMLRELTRLRAERAGQALSDAAGSMDEAGRQLTRGQDSPEQQEETLDRLNEARRRLQQARKEVEEELAREKLAKVADQLKLFKTRQEAAIAEMTRIQNDVLLHKGWERGLRASLDDLADAQKGLADETRALAEGKLAGAKVFARVLGKSARAMTAAARRMQDRGDKVKDNPDDTTQDRETHKLQRQALRHLDQLLDAVKSGTAMARAGGGASGGGGGGRRGGEGDGIPQLAQLKALRALQQDINEDTEAFGKRHPDLNKLTGKEFKELQGLRDSQREVADLLDELTAPAAAEGENP